MKDGAGRILAAALWVAVLGPASTTRAVNESVGTETDNSGEQAWAGWSTQRWPMHGQRGDQRRRINVDFTRAQMRSGGSVGYPNAWKTYRPPGDSEVVTAFIPGLGRLGPHASLAVSTGFSVLGGFTTAAAPGYFNGFLSIPSLCGSFVGSPIMVADSETYPYEFNLGSATVKMQVGVAQVFAASTCGWLQQILMQTAFFSVPGTSPPTEDLWSGGIVIGAEALTGVPQYSPAMLDGVLYVATTRPGPLTINGVYDDHLYHSGFIHALGTGTAIGEPMSDRWTAVLQTGSESSGPLPKGQEPPPAAERFWPTTPVAVSDSLVVVGCRGWTDDWSFGYRREVHAGYVLFVFDRDSGALRWTYEVGNEIMPTPAITDELVILGTRDGRVYAITHAGFLKWQTSWAERVTYRTHPFSTPQALGDAALYGPAIDQTGDAAYFGGSDGRVHRYDVSSGGRTSSEVLLFFREVVGYWEPWSSSWRIEPRRDGNGLEIIRPCPISSAPAIYRNRWLVVKNHTNTQWGPEVYGGAEVDRNGAFLCILSLPTMTMEPNARDWTTNASLDPDRRAFRGGGLWGAIGLNNSGSGLWGYHPLHQIRYINDPGEGMEFSQGVQSDPGGVSIGDGFVFATDGTGAIVAIPSNEDFEPEAASGSIEPKPPVPGPEPDPGPPALGPVEAFPNPFMPSRAKGGTFKFRNLPMGSRVELYTLAFERVKSLQESDHRAEWDATNEAGQPVATGVYLYKIFLPDDRPPITGRVALTR